MLKKIFFALMLISSLIYAAEINQPEFNLKTIDGKIIKVKGNKNGLDIPAFKGKAVILEFWGTHCPPCLYSISHYIKLKNKYKDKMAMLAVEVQMTPKDELIKFAKAKGINYNVLTQTENMNFVRYIAARSGWRGGIPFLLIFDKNGDIITIHTGYLSENYVDKLIQFALKDKKTAQDNNTTKESNTTNR